MRALVYILSAVAVGLTGCVRVVAFNRIDRSVRLCGGVLAGKDDFAKAAFDHCEGRAALVGCEATSTVTGYSRTQSGFSVDRSHGTCCDYVCTR